MVLIKTGYLIESASKLVSSDKKLNMQENNAVLLYCQRDQAQRSTCPTKDKDGWSATYLNVILSADIRFNAILLNRSFKNAAEYILS